MRYSKSLSFIAGAMALPLAALAFAATRQWRTPAYEPPDGRQRPISL